MLVLAHFLGRGPMVKVVLMVYERWASALHSKISKNVPSRWKNEVSLIERLPVVVKVIDVPQSPVGDFLFVW
jgi:hypothetical protein